MAKKRVVVTGATGYIAAQLLPALQPRYELVLLDARRENRDGQVVEGVQVVDLARRDVEPLRPHFAGADAVVHLAYHLPANRKDPEPSYYGERSNVDMAFNVCLLALEEGLQRVVMASSNHAADWYEPLILAKKKERVDPYELPLSDNTYGWAKAAYEQLSFLFACGGFGRPLEVAQIRIGAPRDLTPERDFKSLSHMKRNLGAYISPRDLRQLFVRCLEAESFGNPRLDGVPFHIFYGISDNTRNYWGLANARATIGYEPEDDSEVKFLDRTEARLYRGEGRDHPGRTTPGRRELPGGM